MAAQSLQVFTLDIPNPEWNTIGSNPDAYRINGNVSFNFLETIDIVTISDNGASPGQDVTGLLYVPDLEADDPCFNASAPFVPSNVTRQANLPEEDYELIAIAPWTSPDCAFNYVRAARADSIQGFLFFLPDNTTMAPPDASDNTWNINGADSWKQENGFPVYAIPGANGHLLMLESSLYSGNMTEVPYGHDLTEMYDPRDYVRLFVDVNLGADANSLPSLWVFLLVVLGILLVIIGLTSLSMHFIQRRRRRALRRRVASGEVDLEALGIKRLTVPQELLDQMPLYTYGTGQPVSQPSQVSGSAFEEKLGGKSPQTSKTSKTSKPIPALVSRHSYRPNPLSQPTCAICLDDYVAAETGTEGTTVRELPCHHIFHPECVDTFLRDSSSLCPMCKKTALPKGYCPKIITNAMVRRERMVRQIRERIDPDAPDNGLPGARRMTGLRGLRSRTMSGFSQFRLGGRRPDALPEEQDQQMEQLSSSTQMPVIDRSVAPPPEESSASEQLRVQPPSTPTRREWARQRAVAMLGQRAPADPDADESRRIPAWRKALRGIFPSR